jgi:hypothetical protein
MCYKMKVATVIAWYRKCEDFGLPNSKLSNQVWESRDN